MLPIAISTTIYAGVIFCVKEELNNLNDLTVWKFIYADDICLGTQAHTFVELECSLTADMARMAQYCHRWRLKPSVTKTDSSVFHLHNAAASRELTVMLNGARLKHIYLGVTLDRTLTNRAHLEKTASKLKTQNNLLMKLVVTTWGANATPSDLMLWLFATQSANIVPQSGHGPHTPTVLMYSSTRPCV
jgi:hypothetical protein